MSVFINCRAWGEHFSESGFHRYQDKTRAARDAVKNFPAKVKNGQKQEKNMDVWKNNEHYFFPDTL